MDLKVYSKYYSFDIFDTLVFRLAKSPKEVFTFIARSKKVKEITSAFAEVRVNSEYFARKNSSKSGSNETTLDEIYYVFQKLTRCSDIQRDFLKDFEVQTEIDLIRPTNFGRDLLNKLRKNGVRYVLTSDMYLPKIVILQILEKCGIVGFEKLFVSSDYKKTKHHGDLYKVVVDYFGVEPAEIVHVGDNEHADIVMAKHAGLQTQLAPSSVKLQHLSKYGRKNTAVFSGWQPITQAFVAQYFEDLEVDGRSTDKEWTADEYYETLGECVLAPLMASFVIWLRDRAIDKGVTHMNFLARDGKFMREVFDCLFGSELSSSYIAGSRRMITLPFSLLSSTTVRNFISATVMNSKTVGEVYDKLGTGPALETHLNTFGLGRDRKLDDDLRNDFLGVVTENTGVFLASFESERQQVQEYYRTHFPKGRITGFVDIGWRGSLQRALLSCLPELEASEVQGFYLATTGEAFDILDESECEHDGFICRSGIHPTNCSNVHILCDVFEFLMSSDHGSVTGLHKDGTWRMAELGDGEWAAMQLSSKIQQAALKAIVSLKDRIGIDGLRKLSVDYDASDVWEALLRPSQFDALQFKNVRVFSGIGDKNGEYLTNFFGKKSMYRNYRSSRWPQAYAASLSKWQRNWVNISLKLRKLPKIAKI